MNEKSILKDLLEKAPLYTTSSISKSISSYDDTQLFLKEIDYECPTCECIRPFHNTDSSNVAVVLSYNKSKEMNFADFTCVSCNKHSKFFLLYAEKIEGSIINITKIGEFPQKELKRSKALSKFFKSDKEEYNKAVICMANGYGVASYAYMRRIVENNILSLLEQIQEVVAQDSDIAKSINELKATSPMSDRIKIANNALPDYLKPDGFNPLGQIYGLLSDGVHSLSDSECLDKAENIQACLEFLISELAAHKQNKEDFKKRLAALKSK
ncbi:hypothetical protein F3J02_01545 [Acinetobacter sp. Tr-809]|uniref:hypothetical protein n=1 Tax=Acinetobacter sp. Tr-809 TaxID=2608324 RepID=UPI00141DA23B|nr:hypothetical protein [Acinetobacter sp. Tr-809]NIE95177.1 hypothetical protein [Acinetobacter sp. Tr-809]